MLAAPAPPRCCGHAPPAGVIRPRAAASASSPQLAASTRRLCLRPSLPASRPPPRRRTAHACVTASSAAVSAFIEASFPAATVYTVVLYAFMLRGRPSRAALTSLRPFAPLAVLYVVLLALSWQPDTVSLMLPGSLEEGLRTGAPQFFPSLSGIMALLSRRATAASAWVHLLTINAFSGRHIYLDGLRRRLPVAHSLALSLLAGPLGLACHLLTARAAAAWRVAKRARRLRERTTA